MIKDQVAEITYQHVCLSTQIRSLIAVVYLELKGYLSTVTRATGQGRGVKIRGTSFT